MHLRIKAYAPNGASLGVLPSPLKVSATQPMNDHGALTMEYGLAAPRPEVLDTPAELAVEVSRNGTIWVEPRNARYLYLRRGGDDLAKPARINSEGLGYAWRLSTAKVLPFGALDSDGKRKFLSQTPGSILRALLMEAQGRQALQGLLYDFNHLTDSAGVAWGSTLTIYYEPGMDYLTILRNLADQGIVDFWTEGRTLRVFRAESPASARRLEVASPTPVVLRQGRDLTEAPFRGTWENMADYALVQGEDGKVLEKTQAAKSAWGRQEVYITQGGVSDDGTMNLLADASLAQASQERVERTYGLTLADAPFLPLLDYFPGDYVGIRTVGKPQAAYRVRQVTMERDEKAQVSGNAVLNDRFLEAEVRQARRVQGIVNGAQSSGGSGTAPAPGPDAPDTTPPAVPQDGRVTVDTYTTPQGDLRAVARLAWDPVTTNFNGSPTDDVERYEVRWKTGSAVPNGEPQSLSPASPHVSLQDLWDRRDKPFGWIGGDGAASVRLPSGKDWWAFGDTALGTVDSRYRIQGPWGMVNNCLVETDPANRSHFRTLVGAPNLAPTGLATASKGYAWAHSGGTSAIVDEPDAFGGTAIELKSTSDSSTFAYPSTPYAQTEGMAWPVSPGDVLTIQFTVRGVGLAGSRLAAFRLYDQNTNFLDQAGGDFVTTPQDGSPATYTYVSKPFPQGVTSVKPMLYALHKTGEAIRYYDMAVYRGNQRHQSYSVPAGKNYEATVRPEAVGHRGKDWRNAARGLDTYLRQNAGTRPVVLMGDQTATNANLAVAQRWPTLLASSLVGQYGAGVTVPVVGSTGYTLRSMTDTAAFWTSVKAQNPGHGLVLAGYSDGTSRTIAQVAQDALDFVAKWKAQVPGKGLTVALWIDAWRPPVEKTWPDYVKAVRDALRDSTGVDVVALGDHLTLEKATNYALNPAMVGLATDGVTVAAYSHNGNYTKGTQKTGPDGVPYMSVDFVAGSPSESWGFQTSIAANALQQGDRLAVKWEVRGRVANTEVSPAQYAYGVGSGAARFIRSQQGQTVGTDWAWVESTGSTEAYDPATMGAVAIYLYATNYTSTWDRKAGLDVRRVIVTKVTAAGDSVPIAYFDGSTAPAAGWITEWSAGGTWGSASRTVRTNWLGDGIVPSATGAQMVSKALFDRLQDPLSDYYWMGDTWTANGKAYVLLQMVGPNWPTPQGWNFNFRNRTDVGVWDAATGALESIQTLSTSTISWTDAVYVDGSWVYVFGHKPDGSAVLMRTPTANPFSGAVYWTGSAWSSSAATLGNLTTGKTVSSVRKIGTTFHAYYVDGFSTQIKEATASALTGPWTLQEEPVYRMPEVGGPVQGYIPRQHPQFDTSAGLVFGYSRNTSENWAGEAGTRNCGPSFARGPAAAPGAPDLTNAPWLGLTTTTDANAAVSPLLPGTAFYAEVRALDQEGNASADPQGQPAWAGIGPVITGGDTTAPSAPSKPVAAPFFQGVTVQWNGLDYNGGPPAKDWRRVEVHVSEVDSFIPTAATFMGELPETGGTLPVHGLKAASIYFTRLVAVDWNGLRSEPSDQAWTVTEQLVNADLPDDLIEAANVADGAISVRSLNVAGWSDSLIPNLDFEGDWEGAIPWNWRGGFWQGNSETSPQKVTGAESVAGNTSWRHTITPGNGRMYVATPQPVVERTIYYAGIRLKTSRAVTDGLDFGLAYGATPDDASGWNRLGLVNGPILNSDGTTTYYVRGEVPAGTKFAAPVIILYPETNQATPYTVTIGEVEFKKIVGGANLAEASILNAHISYLDLNVGNVSDLTAGKISAGTMSALMTLSGEFRSTDGRFRAGTYGVRTYDTAGNLVSEMRSADGGLISRYFRTNTSGARIEMGTYSTGAGSAMMSFYPDTAAWQFPPAIGFGGGGRYNLPGLGIHSGSVSASAYGQYGMHMLGLSQDAGFNLVTGNLLNGTAAPQGAPIVLNANGPRGIVDILSGTGNNSRIYLHPDSTKTVISMNRGKVNFGVEGSDLYTIGHVYAAEWGGWPYNHLHFNGNSTFRWSTGQEPQAMTLSPGGIIGGPDWNGAARIKTRGSDQHYVCLFYDGTNFGMIAYDRMNGNQVDVAAFARK